MHVHSNGFQHMYAYDCYTVSVVIHVLRTVFNSELGDDMQKK